jgi:hypothetical protein
MSKSTELLTALKGLGITNESSTVEGVLPLKGDETEAELKAILKAVKAAVKASSDTNQGNESDEEEVAKVTTSLVWVKGRTYINATQRIDAGLYRLESIPERLAKSTRDVVEVFADVIPPRKLTEIAKWSGISHTEDYDDKQLLEKIVVADLKPF